MALTQYVAFLVFKGALHEKGEDLIEKGSSSKLSSFVRDLLESGFTDGRSAVLDLEKEPHDFVLFHLVDGQLRLVLFFEDFGEVLSVLGFEKCEVPNARDFGREFGSQPCSSSHSGGIGTFLDFETANGRNGRRRK